ncbi:MAG: DUF4433 domain-containing protein [Gammaproteobacteria bacterium]|nr:DUF4433 domain-containing protein [Gammaproteobacteria bacterium]MYE23633.1 DUF4433 domain-containing protein [Gammaproteobacteria bacterium]
MVDEAAGDVVLGLAKKRRIRRLCHFTRLESLRLMIEDRCIKPSTEVGPDWVNDKDRYDGHLGHVCCSITYPNVYLLNQFAKDDLDAWCVLLLKCDLLGEPGVRFCPVNAATANGQYVQGGALGFMTLFEEEVRVGNRPRKRTPRQPASVPTDNQAEVLVPGRVSLTFLLEVVVASNAGLDRAGAALRRWPSFWGMPKPQVRLEERMFRPEVYWDLKLFSDPLPLPPVPFDEGT